MDQNSTTNLELKLNTLVTKLNALTLGDNATDTDKRTLNSRYDDIRNRVVRLQTDIKSKVDGICNELYF